MSTKAATTIYIEPEQKKRIKSIANKKGVSSSGVIRSAINIFLLQKQEATISPNEVEILLKEASKSLGRMIVKIDMAHEAVTSAFKKMEKIK